MKCTLPLMIACVLTAVSAGAQSPYAGQERNEIASLSAHEKNGLLAGHGMGLAKAAELNRYPGPMHVLELADDLALNDGQQQRTAALMRDVKQQASALGRKIVDGERELDALFKSQTVSPESLERALLELGRLRAQLRYVHLAAHLQQAAILSDEQISRYVALRGYGDGQGHHQHGAGKRHGHRAEHRGTSRSGAPD